MNVADDVVHTTKKFNLTIFRQGFKQRDGSKAYTRGWFYRRSIAGDRVLFPVGVNKTRGEKLAEEIFCFLAIPTNTLEMALDKYDPRRKERVAAAVKWATFGEILETFEKARHVIGKRGKEVKMTTFKGYKSSLLTLVRKVQAYRSGKPFESFEGRRGVDFSPWLNMESDYLMGQTATDFKLCIIPPPPEGEDEPDEEEVLTAKISADSVLRNAAAVFSEAALRYYNKVGLRIPDLKEFLDEPTFGAKKFFVLLPPDVIANIARQSLLLRVEDPKVYIAYLLTMHCGLRKGEALAFDTSWLRAEDLPTLYIAPKGKFNPKHGHGRKATIQQWVFDELLDLGPTTLDAMDRLNHWVKNLIPAEHKVSKPIHELRKCWVSFKAKTEGIHTASVEAGHNDPKVTTTHYADNRMSDKLLVIWRRPVADAAKELAAS